MTEREWEQRMLDNGLKAFIRQQADLREHGMEDRTVAGQRAIKTSVGPLAEAILDRCKPKKRGPGQPSRVDVPEFFNEECLRLLARPGKSSNPARGAEVLAFITIRATLSGASDGDERTKVTLALKIGREVEREVRSILRRDSEVEGERWTGEKRLRIGSELLDLFAQSNEVIDP